MGIFHCEKVKIKKFITKNLFIFIFSSLKERLLPDMAIKVSIAAVFITKTSIFLNEFWFIRSAIANMGFRGLRRA